VVLDHPFLLAIIFSEYSCLLQTFYKFDRSRLKTKK